jgi:hypothetical protein
MTADQAMIWFGVIIAMNLQTSFLTPPFGFALFYLRSVAAKFDYKDRVSGKTIAAVKTTEIYKGSIAFICLQLTMLVAVMVFPDMVTGGIEKVETLNSDQIMEQLQMPATEEPAADAPAEAAPGTDPAKTDEVDPMKAMQDEAAKDGAKKP